MQEDPESQMPRPRKEPGSLSSRPVNWHEQPEWNPYEAIAALQRLAEAEKPGASTNLQSDIPITAKTPSLPLNPPGSRAFADQSISGSKQVKVVVLIALVVGVLLTAGFASHMESVVHLVAIALMLAMPLNMVWNALERGKFIWLPILFVLTLVSGIWGFLGFDNSLAPIFGFFLTNVVAWIYFYRYAAHTIGPANVDPEVSLEGV